MFDFYGVPDYPRHFLSLSKNALNIFAKYR